MESIIITNAWMHIILFYGLNSIALLCGSFDDPKKVRHSVRYWLTNFNCAYKFLDRIDVPSILYSVTYHINAWQKTGIMFLTVLIVSSSALNVVTQFIRNFRFFFLSKNAAAFSKSIITSKKSFSMGFYNKWRYICIE